MQNGFKGNDQLRMVILSEWYLLDIIKGTCKLKSVSNYIWRKPRILHLSAFPTFWDPLLKTYIYFFYIFTHLLLNKNQEKHIQKPLYNLINRLLCILLRATCKEFLQVCTPHAYIYIYIAHGALPWQCHPDKFSSFLPWVQCHSTSYQLV